MHSDTWPFLFFRFFFGGECLVDAISPSPGLPAHLLRSLWPRKWQGGGGPGQKRWISSRWGDSIHHMEIHHGCFDRWLFFFLGGIESSKHRKWSILLNGNANLNIKILKNHPKTAVLTLSDNISFFFSHIPVVSTLSIIGYNPLQLWHYHRLSPIIYIFTNHNIC